MNNVETERSRIVLKELEPDWWVLASIDFTQLPVQRGTDDTLSKSAHEYSAREVAPAPLLLAQLIRAHSLFLLHHATSLQELYERVGRKQSCDLLERYWTAYVDTWDVLLHGNPSATIFHAIKLSSIGELGIGVGEEIWGSGEREVLEGFVDRTEGLLDMVVGRYGSAATASREKEHQERKQDEMWLGHNADAAAVDGIIFSGRGSVSRDSLRTISHWMEAIYTYGDRAYGVSDNPGAPMRQRNRRRAVRPASSSIITTRQDDDKRAQKNADVPPAVVPPPLVHPRPSTPTKRPHSRPVDRSQSGTAAASTQSKQDSTGSGTETMMKYLTLGYGTAWTLNPKGLTSSTTTPVNATSTVRTEPSVEVTAESKPKAKTGDASGRSDGLQHVDPAPEPSDAEMSHSQNDEQTLAKFLIGLTGDLDETELRMEDDGDEADDNADTGRNRRISLRTLNVIMAKPKNRQRDATIRKQLSKESLSSVQSFGTKRSLQESIQDCARGSSVRSQKSVGPKTSAAASIDGSQPNVQREKVQVAVYVYRPFIFVFLFALHTPALTMPAFYRSLHNQLGPLQKPLLKSTDPARMHQRIADAVGERKVDVTLAQNPIYDLTYDPTKMSLRTTIPNIPEPCAPPQAHASARSVNVSGSWYTLGIPIGSPHDSQMQSSLSKLPASGLANADTDVRWSRSEALSTHTQLLALYASTRSDSARETTVKTARGFWVNWIKMVPSRTQRAEHVISGSPVALGSKEAILVRRGAEKEVRKAEQPRAVSGRWLLREQRRDASNVNSIVEGSTSARNVSDGIGIDVKRWVDGLMALTQ